MSSKEAPETVTDLLRRWQAGNLQALDSLVPLIYSELKRIAAQYLRKEREGHTLQPTALVNEAYLRLADQVQGSAANRTHFIGIAANLMRQVLVDHARTRRAAKRDGGQRVELAEHEHPIAVTDIDLITLDEALARLAQFDSRLAQLVEMRFFGGLSIDETAAALDMSPATVKREWATARAWLNRELSVHP
jgi:RNA polymerase sigma factor (TIGR02999 family)